ncbi:hypothetical protein ACFL08_01010 [Patescibacteria group bacterium]
MKKKVLKKNSFFGVDYPDVLLWNKDLKESEKLEIINKGDFTEEDILSGLGVASHNLRDTFGICDKDEIKGRQDLVRFFIENPEAMQHVIYKSVASQIPDEKNKFLNFFDPIQDHNPYWKTVRDFISACAGSKSQRLNDLVSILKSSLPLEEKEKEMAAIISERVETIAVIEGVVSADVFLNPVAVHNPKDEKVDTKSEDADCADVEEYQYQYRVEAVEMESNRSKLSTHVHGHKMHSFALSDARRHPYPPWVYNKWNILNWVGFGIYKKKSIDDLNEKERQKAYRDMVINNMTDGLKRDIASSLVKLINKLKLDSNYFSGGSLRVYFSYSDKGLILKILGFDPSVKSTVDKGDKFYFEEHAGYSLEMLKSIRAARGVLQSEFSEHRRRMQISNVEHQISENFPDFFLSSHKFPSPYTDEEHKWFSLENFYASQELSPTHEAIKFHRDFFSSHMDKLREVATLALCIKRKSEELGINLCFPEILDGDHHHVVSFGEIYPVHLLGRDDIEEVKAIKGLPDLNGQMLCLTGRHGGGKTVSSLSVTDNVFLAQSGLPVFGTTFRLNIKKALGMVFVERGAGSTSQLILDKMKNILEVAQKYEGKNIVFVIDEIGLGTQESSGFKLGVDLLTALSNAGVSVLFSTQIMSLAEYARDNLSADCIYADKHHVLHAGINDGAMQDLRREKGIDTLLKKINKKGRK